MGPMEGPLFKVYFCRAKFWVKICFGWGGCLEGGSGPPPPPFTTKPEH